MSIDRRLRVTGNAPLIAPGVFSLVLSGDVSGIERPGQFVNIKIDGLFLRRPISVCEIGGDWVMLIVKNVGEGTERLSRLKSGAELDVLVGLGNGFDVTKSGDSPLLLGGGTGVAPLLWLSRALRKNGARPTAILGFNTASEMFLADELAEYCEKVVICTVDGSMGEKGFVTGPMKNLDYTYFYACGPEPMLKAVCGASTTSGEVSFERRMGCGFGACMGCSCKTKYGDKRICRDGPILQKEEIIW